MSAPPPDPLRHVAVGAASAVAAVAVFFLAWSLRGGGSSSSEPPEVRPRPPQAAPAPPPEGGAPRFDVRDPRCTGSADGATCVFDLVPSWGSVPRADIAGSSVTSWSDELGTDLAAELARPAPNRAGVSAAVPGADRSLRVSLATPRAPAAAALRMTVAGVLKATFAGRPGPGEDLDIPFAFTAPVAREVPAR